MSRVLGKSSENSVNKKKTKVLTNAIIFKMRINGYNVVLGPIVKILF